jgi:hypothetical protein
MNRLTSASATAVALLSAALFSLLALSERAGLPLVWVKVFLCLLGGVACLLLIALSRSVLERQFFGHTAIANPWIGGLSAGALLTLATEVLLRPATGSAWLATILGAVVGFASAQSLLRLTRRGTNTSSTREAESLRGVAVLGMGTALLLAAVSVAVPEAARLLGLSTSAALALVLALTITPVLAGGSQGATALMGGLALAGVSGATLLLVASGTLLGPLPLPGLSDTATLEAVMSARTSWQVERPLHLLVWPEFSSVFVGENLQSLFLAALLAAGWAMAATPAVPMARRTTMMIAVVTAIILPMAFMALGGYAIEAAAVRFIGAPMAKPPASMVDASELGLMTACGVQASTAEAIRTACGVSPRDTSLFTWQQVHLAPAFVESGYAVALGFSAAFSLATSAVKFFLALALATLGLWFAANGLGRDLIARNNAAAGLASLRMGKTRLAGVLVVGMVLAVQVSGLNVAREALLWLGATGAFLIVVAHLLTPRVQQRTGPAMPVQARTRRRKKMPTSAESEPA